MNIHQSLFEISAASVKQFPKPSLPEIVFVGRSNVGKSTLLNTITGRKQLAKVSATPGKTRLINFFRVDEKLRFVDLPGYGYAKVPQSERASWGKLITAYLTSGRPIVLVVLLVDSRHQLQDLDAEMLDLLMDWRLPTQIVLTKSDKLSQKDRSKRQRELFSAFKGRGYEGDLLSFSSVKGWGKKELLSIIFQASGM